jgi:hypothetical protein
MGGAFGGLLSVLEYVGTLILAALIGKSAFKEGQGTGWKLFFGSFSLSILIGSILALSTPLPTGQTSLTISTFIGLSIAYGILVLLPLLLLVFLLWVIREKLEGRWK